MLTTYVPVNGSAGAEFTILASCLVNWGVVGASLNVYELNGTVSCGNDPVVPNAGVFTWALTSIAQVSGSPALPVTTVDMTGAHFLSLHPSANRSACMYTPDSHPTCRGDSYYADSWANTAPDEWQEGTWGSSWVSGTADINTMAGSAPECLIGGPSRTAPGPLSSIVGGGWDALGRVGGVVLSSQRHTPLWTGLRAFDAPGRCSVFTVALATLYASHLCGPALPYTAQVGVFGNLTGGAGGVGPNDLHFWRRHQFPRAGLEYRTALPYKLQLDVSAYVGQSPAVITFEQVQDYLQNMSAITDGYPQVPYLVGWQGLGHDTLYPGWDVVNAKLGGATALAALAAAVPTLTSSNFSTLSAHLNGDESYSRYSGEPNPEFDLTAIRLNVDHATPWCSNCSVTHEQFPDCGLRCSLSKAKDAAVGGRYERYGRFLTTFPLGVLPQGLRSVHEDAWRDVGASWEANGVFLPHESEQFCGQEADAAFWRDRAGASLGCEGTNGQAAEFMGVIQYFYHGDGLDPAYFGRIVAGSALGFDTDIACVRGGCLCRWGDIADRFWLTTKLYQLALTQELLGLREEDGSLHFTGGGRVHRTHLPPSPASHHSSSTPAAAAAHTPSLPGSISTWPFGGDSIPVKKTLEGGVESALLPLITPDGTIAPFTLHAYASSGSAPPPPNDPSCPLYNSSQFWGADNTALGDWNGQYLAQFEIDPALPLEQAIGLCNSSCWGNSSCGGWDLIKVTPESGKTKPLCTLVVTPVGCDKDPNQVAGTKVVLPPPGPSPPPGSLLNLTFTLPLSWVGKSVSAVTSSPTGPIVGQPGVSIKDRELLLVGVYPGWAARLEAQ
jgi:hypothetical protein